MTLEHIEDNGLQNTALHNTNRQIFLAQMGDIDIYQG
jgi:hypothetical protein